MPGGQFRNEDIELLEELEHVRRRPAMYVGDPSTSEALVQVVLEPLCLAIDEHTGGPANAVTIELRSDGSVSIHNDGMGIPTSERSDGASSLETIMTRLGACRDGKANAEHRQWCGVGVAITNALSRWCRVEVHRDGSCWRQSYERGRPTSPVERSPGDDSHGTLLEFLPDETILSARLDAETIAERLAAFHEEVPCVRVELRDGRTPGLGPRCWPALR